MERRNLCLFDSYQACIYLLQSSESQKHSSHLYPFWSWKRKQWIKNHFLIVNSIRWDRRTIVQRCDGNSDLLHIFQLCAELCCDCWKDEQQCRISVTWSYNSATEKEQMILNKKPLLIANSIRWNRRTTVRCYNGATKIQTFCSSFNQSLCCDCWKDEQKCRISVTWSYNGATERKQMINLFVTSKERNHELTNLKCFKCLLKP